MAPAASPTTWPSQKTVFTPDAAGVLASVTGEVTSADGTPPVLMDDSVVNVPVEDWPDLCADEDTYEPEYETNLSEWLEAQLTLPMVIEARGYTFAGRSTLNGKPSVRYENGSSMFMGIGLPTSASSSRP